MAAIVGAAIAAGAGIYGGYRASKAQGAAQSRAYGLNDRQKAFLREDLLKLKSQDQLFSGLQRSNVLKAQQAELSGYKGARKGIELGGIAAKQTVQGQGKQTLADAEQSIVSRGLLGTSTGSQAALGVQDRTAAQLASIDTQLAQSFADLGLQEASIKGFQGRELGALDAADRESQLDIGYELAAAGSQYTADQYRNKDRQDAITAEKRAKQRKKRKGRFSHKLNIGGLSVGHKFAEKSIYGDDY